MHSKFRKGIVATALILAIVASVGLTGGCSSSSYYASPQPLASTQPTGSTASNQVVISNFAFNPAQITVPVGTQVTFANNDGASHTVTADNGDFDSGTLKTGQTFTYTFNKAGTFSYHCNFHTYMKGAVTVH